MGLVCLFLSTNFREGGRPGLRLAVQRNVRRESGKNERPPVACGLAIDSVALPSWPKAVLRGGSGRDQPAQRRAVSLPHGLTAVPAQAHAVLAVGGFEGDAVDLPAVVHGNPHGTAQAAVIRTSRPAFHRPPFRGQNLAGEGEWAGRGHVRRCETMPPACPPQSISMVDFA